MSRPTLERGELEGDEGPSLSKKHGKGTRVVPGTIILDHPPSLPAALAKVASPNFHMT